MSVVPVSKSIPRHTDSRPPRLTEQGKCCVTDTGLRRPLQDKKSLVGTLHKARRRARSKRGCTRTWSRRRTLHSSWSLGGSSDILMPLQCHCKFRPDMPNTQWLLRRRLDIRLRWGMCSRVVETFPARTAHRCCRRRPRSPERTGIGACPCCCRWTGRG